MKDRTENRNQYPGLDRLSTPELEDLLRQDFAAAGEDGPDVDVILAVMEVINSREEDIPEADPEAAWTAFRETVIEKDQEEVPPTPVVVPFKKPRKLRWAMTAAAVVCVLAGVLVVPVAGNENLEPLIRWTEEVFFFRGNDPDSDLHDEIYVQTKETGAKLTDLPVIPTWYPDGMAIESVEELDLINGKSVGVLYSFRGEAATFSITVYDDSGIENTGTYQKNAGPVEEYYANGIPHYIVGNMERNTAVWRNENVECFIQGYISVEDLKKMIDSIYE